MAGSPTTRCPRSPTRTRASWSRPTTGSPPRTIPHHITSDYLDGYRARRIEQLITAQPEHDLESFEAMQTDMLSLPGLETARRLARLRPRDQRELAAIERLRSWDGRMSPESIAATIYQAFTLRLGREVTRAAIEDRDLAERWLDRADNGFVAHVTSPWRWQSHLLALWEEGDEDLVGRLLGRARPRCVARGPGRPRRRAGARPGGVALGQGPSARLRARARRGESPARRGSSTAGSRSAAARRRSPRWAGIRTTRSRRSGRPAGGWSPTR